MSLIKKLSQGVSKIPLALTLASALTFTSFLPRDVKAEVIENSRQTFSAPAKKKGGEEIEVLRVQTARDDAKKELYATFIALNDGDIINYQISLSLPDWALLKETKAVEVRRSLKGGAKEEETIISPRPQKEKYDFGKKLRELIEESAIAFANPASQAPPLAEEIVKLLPFYKEAEEILIPHDDIEEKARKQGNILHFINSHYSSGADIPGTGIRILKYTFSTDGFQRNIQVQDSDGRKITGKYPPDNSPLEAQLIFDIGVCGAEGAKGKLVSNTAFFQRRVEAEKKGLESYLPREGEIILPNKRIIGVDETIGGLNLKQIWGMQSNPGYMSLQNKTGNLEERGIEKVYAHIIQFKGERGGIFATRVYDFKSKELCNKFNPSEAGENIDDSEKNLKDLLGDGGSGFGFRNGDIYVILFLKGDRGAALSPSEFIPFREGIKKYTKRLYLEKAK